MENIEDFKIAGEIAGKIREESKKLLIIDEYLLDIAETIEQMIRDEGAEPAFPVNLSVNNIAAHYTPSYKDDRTLKDKDIIKVDIGVKYGDGIGDTAYTFSMNNEHTDMIETAKKALYTAIDNIKPGVKTGEIGGKIEEVIRGAGYKPIVNLTGHKIENGILHAGIDVPNIATQDEYEFQEGDIFAIEPFVSNGKGWVNDKDQVEIFAFHNPGPVRSRNARKILETIIKKYQLLPFAERWLIKEFNSKLMVKSALKEMIKSKVIKVYPVLAEQNESIVTQYEHTLLVTENGCEVLTKPK